MNLEVVPALAAVHEGWGGKDLIVRVKAEVDAITFAFAGLALAGLGFVSLGLAVYISPPPRWVSSSYARAGRVVPVSRV